MPRQLAIALVIVLAALHPSMSYAEAPVTFIGCPTGQAVRGINFLTRSVVCVPVGGDTAALQTRIAALEGALASAQATIACMSKVGTDVFFDGCNVHIRSGITGSVAVNGLGNLIIGYNNDRPDPHRLLRTGSHNLVIGPFHSYSSFAGVVTGFGNTISGRFASVIGGEANVASGDLSSIIGGDGNTASAGASSISGGVNNTASGNGSSVSGGVGNTASGFTSSVSGGESNLASGAKSSVSGGNGRSATGDHDWAAGSLSEDQ